MRAAPPFHYLVLFYAAYVLAGGFGQGLALVPGVAVTFWPPAGIFVAALLLTRKLSWPWWIFAGCLAELTCNAIWFHNAVYLALIYFTANALVALTAAGLIRRVTDKPFRLETLDEVAAFVVLGAGVAPMVSATLIAATDALSGKHPFWTAWPLVWLGDGTGLLVSAPLTLVAVQIWRDWANVRWPRVVEAALLLAALLAVCVLAFKDYLPTPYLTLPFLMWIAVRFQIKGVAVAMALVAITEALFAMTSEGAAAGQADLMQERVVGLQAFLGIAAISSLVVAVLSIQHQQAVRLLKDANAGLETRVKDRTAALQASERQLAAMFAASDVGMAQADPASRRLLRVNAAMSAITGYNEAELLTLTVDELNHPDDRAQDAEAWRNLGNGYAIEKRYVRKNGGVVWVQVTVNLIRDAHGNPLRAAAIVHDITARKKAEKALQESERFSRSVLEASPDCVKVMAPDGRLEFMNTNGRKQMEIDDFSVCAGAPWGSLWPEETRQTIDDSIAAAKSGVESRFEAFCPTAKGTPKWWDVAATPVIDAEGRCTRIVSVSRDITARKQAEEAVRESERRLAAVLEALPIGVALIDREGKPLISNEAFKRFVPGVIPSRDEAHYSLWEGYDAEGRRIERQDYAGARALRGERVWPGLEFLYHGDLQRGPVWTRIAAVPLHNVSGEIVGATAVVTDVDQEKRAKDALRDSERRLELASEAGGLGFHEYNVATGHGTWSASLWHLLALEGEGEVPFERVVELVHPDDRGRVRAAMEAIMRKLGPYQLDYRIRRADGTVLWVTDRGEAVGPINQATGSVAVVRGTLLDITERKRHEDHQKMLMNELNHRVKNTLATIQSIASQTLRTSPDLAEAKTRFDARLMSLSKAHDVLTREKWDSAPLADIVDRAITPYRGSKRDRFSVSGPNIRIPAQMALGFAMTLHELCTNAVKYGALSKDKGKVMIAWKVSSPKKHDAILTFRWREMGGPVVVAPSSQGFGTKLIERALASDLGGNVKISFAKRGVTCVIVASLNKGEGHSQA